MDFKEKLRAMCGETRVSTYEELQKKFTLLENRPNSKSSINDFESYLITLAEVLSVFGTLLKKSTNNSTLSLEEYKILHLMEKIPYNEEISKELSKLALDKAFGGQFPSN